MSSYCITTWNVHGLTSSKVESLRSFLKEKQPLAVVLTETHRASASPAEWPRFHGYSVFPLPGQSNRSGGLAFLLRADRIAWGGPEDCSIMVGLNISGRSTKMPDTTSQWAALKLQLHGHKQPIWLVGVYLQPPVTAAVQAEFVKQLHQTVSSHELIASMPNIRRHQLVPQLVLCGDFNTHDASLCAADDHLHSDFLDSILQMGFRCANAPRADAHTHSSGSVLDLFFELAHPQHLRYYAAWSWTTLHAESIFLARTTSPSRPVSIAKWHSYHQRTLSTNGARTRSLKKPPQRLPHTWKGSAKEHLFKTKSDWKILLHKQYSRPLLSSAASRWGESTESLPSDTRIKHNPWRTQRGQLSAARCTLLLLNTLVNANAIPLRRKVGLSNSTTSTKRCYVRRATGAGREPTPS